MLSKNRLKQVVFGFEIRTTAIIGNSLVHSVPKQKTLKLIRKELDKVTRYAKLDRNETHSLWLNSYNRYVRVSKKVFSSLRKSENAYKSENNTDLKYDEYLKIRKNTVYGDLKKEFRGLEHEKNDVADEYEYRAKHDQLVDLFSQGVFYLCSSHKNPAKDHADWEGKIYISKDWKERVSPDEAEKISAYVQNHQIRTVEEITGAPVWLVTRPNCKHYLVPVTVEEVLQNSVRKLLKTHDMYMEPEKEISYEYGQYKTYYERLKMLSYLHSMFDAEDLSKDMSETRKLVQKWKLLSKSSGIRMSRSYRANPSREAA